MSKVKYPDVLIAVLSCEAYADRQDKQLETWIPTARELGFDVQIFDGFRLSVPDDYAHLPHKVKALCKWALHRGYKHILKLDDDSYVWMKRFKIVRADYAGMTMGPNDTGSPRLKTPDFPKGTCPAFYARGGAYWLGEKSMKIIAKSEITDWAEDRWVGNCLAPHGIKILDLPEYRIAWPLPMSNTLRYNPTILVQLPEEGIDEIINGPELWSTNTPFRTLPGIERELIPSEPTIQKLVEKHKIIQAPRLVHSHSRHVVVKKKETKAPQLFDRRRLP